jgi:hypothetical protein
MLKNFLVAAQLAAYQEELSSMKLLLSLVVCGRVCAALC